MKFGIDLIFSLSQLYKRISDQFSSLLIEFVAIFTKSLTGRFDCLFDGNFCGDLAAILCIKAPLSDVV